jgi:mycothiol synthase
MKSSIISLMLNQTNHLSTDEADEVRDLRDRCCHFEGLEIKIETPDPEQDAFIPANAFIYRTGGRLAGYFYLDHREGEEAEVCGMVLPEQRRRGIGRLMLDSVLAECSKRGVTRLLLISEDASASGLAFVRRTGGILSHKELHMQCLTSPKSREEIVSDDITIRSATAADLSTLVDILTEAFDDPEESVRTRVIREIDDACGPFIIGQWQDKVIGCLKVYRSDAKIGLYGVGVLPEFRGRGFGKRIISLTMDMMAEGRPARFALEVEPDNEPARAAYRSCGFEVTTVYGYYTLIVK